MPISFTFPLQGDPPEVTTLLTLEPLEQEGCVELTVSGGLEERLRVPRGYRVASSQPESALALVGNFLTDFALGVREAWVGAGVWPWPFDHLGHDAWPLHVRQLCSLDERVARARASGVAGDPRVRAAIQDQLQAGATHGLALREWLDRSRPQMAGTLAMMREDRHERRVRQVLVELTGGAGALDEDPGTDPNPGLWRIATQETQEQGSVGGADAADPVDGEGAGGVGVADGGADPTGLDGMGSHQEGGDPT